MEKGLLHCMDDDLCTSEHMEVVPTLAATPDEAVQCDNDFISPYGWDVKSLEEVCTVYSSIST